MSKEFPIPNLEPLNDRLATGFGKVRRGRREIRRREEVELRASSFPICPRAYHIYRRTKIENRPKYQESFASEAATEPGTALHAVLQKWFGIEMEDHTYGNWVCNSCRKRRRNKLGLQHCKGCGQEMEYEEYSITATKQLPFSGHIDMVLKVGRLGFLVDFKGSGHYKIMDLRKDGQPKENNYLQVNAYAHAINHYSDTDRFGGVTINKIVLVYIDRGAANRTWLPMQVPLSKKLFRKTVGLIRTGKMSLKHKAPPEGLCTHPTDPHAVWCPWKDLCFDPLLETKLEPRPVPEPKKR